VTALGVGANTAAFSVVDFVLLRPLPFADPETLVRLCEGPRAGGGWGHLNQLWPANYRDFKTMSSLYRLAAISGDRRAPRAGCQSSEGGPHDRHGRRASGALRHRAGRDRRLRAARGMSALLFGVAPGDPATFAAAVGVALLMAFAGSLVPALRAVRVTPMSVLKAV